MNSNELRSLAAMASVISGLLGVGVFALGCSDNNSAPAAGAGGSAGSGGSGGGGNMDGGLPPGLDARTSMLLARGNGKMKPIADTHIHLFQPSRSGVAWPDPANPTL